MKITLAMVISLDGRITQGSDGQASSWASPEDQKIFRQLITDCDCVIMGSATYAAQRGFITPTADTPRYVLTRTPDNFSQDAHRPGLIFFAGTPADVIADCRSHGYQNVLLVGGAATTARFLDAGLVDELLITVEPYIFGEGLPLSGMLHATAHLRLLSARQLNNAGSLLLHYYIEKEDTYHEDTKV